MYPKDSYIVLLSGCNGEDTWRSSIPINYCYKLDRNSFDDDNGIEGFHVYKDKNGKSNGWNCSRGYGDDYNLKMRCATFQEITEYERLGKPFNINELPNSNNYEIY